MLKRVKKRHKGRQAFTLVELIVVLVILAVVAAIVVPILIGYIKKAREARDLEAAEAYRVAIQAVASEYYGLHGTAVVGTTDGTQTPNLRWDKNKKVPNTAEDQKWGEKVLNLAGYDRNTEPYILVFGVAKENNQGINPNQVVYIGYLPDINSPAMFYVNNKWIHEYPKDVGEVKKKNNKNYLVLENGGEVEIQFFVVSNRSSTKNDIWIESVGGEHTLQGHSGTGSYGW
jgi:prepilin-type N-terminal cleavage/methylation domain-containing protein